MCTMILFASIVFLASHVIANCPTTTPVAPGPPKCANYPDGYFINDFTNCQAYYFCPNATSPPYPGKCATPYNFDQSSQMCNHPDNYTCPSERCLAIADYMNIAVDYHNHYRSHHSASDVSAQSSDINQFAQKWADYLSNTDQFYHSGGPYGENLYKSWGGSDDQSVVMADAINSFYSEIDFYDYNNPGFSMQTGHFTQLVWRSSNEIGVGIATYPDSTYGHRTVVCINYRPPGNVQGQFQENVAPPNVSLGTILKRLNSTGHDSDNLENRPNKTMIL